MKNTKLKVGQVYTGDTPDTYYELKAYALGMFYVVTVWHNEVCREGWEFKDILKTFLNGCELLKGRELDFYNQSKSFREQSESTTKSAGVSGKDLILQTMEGLVDRYVKHYKTDFTDYDVDAYKKADEGAQFIWLVRACGTNFHLLPKQLKEKPVYEQEVLELYPRLKDQTLEGYRKERSESIKFELEHYETNKSPSFDVHYFLVTKGVGIEKISYKKAVEAVEV